MIRIFQLAANPVCAPYRLQFPAELLNQTDEFNITTIRKLDAEMYLRVVEHADLFIIQRLPLSSRLRNVIASLNSHGIPVIYEIDDDLTNLPAGSRYAQTAPRDYAQRIEQCIRACQAVQCSTPRLRDRLDSFHSEIAVLENQLPAIPAFIDPPPSKARPLTIVLPFGENHNIDWVPVAEAFNQTVQKLERDGVRFQIWVLGDQQVFDSLQFKNKRYFPLLPRAQYLEVLKQADLAFIPLADLPFNHAKSDIKFLECAAASTAVFASRVVYAQTIRNGETGLLFENSDTLTAGLQKLISDPSLSKKLARGAHRYVAKNRLLTQHIDTWRQTYLQWFEERDKLLQNCALTYQNPVKEVRESVDN